MELFKLSLIFLVIIVVMALRKPLPLAILAGIISTVLLYRLPLDTILQLVWIGSTNWSTISVLLILYLVTFLQRILEMRDQLRSAQQDLNGVFNNNRLNASLSSIFIGLLPSAAASIICAEIVDRSCGDYLDKDEKGFVTSFYRHIPESFLPTYSTVIIMAGLCKVPIVSFVVGMIPMAITLYLIGYFLFLRRVPRKTGAPPSESRRRDFISLLKHLWSLILVVVLIMAFQMEVYAAVGITIALSLLVYRIKPSELRSIFISAMEGKVLLGSYLVMVLKEFVSYTGAIYALPEVFSHLPIPDFLIFALIFFFGSVASGSQAIIAIGTPLAFTAIPNGGMPLMVLLMSYAYAAMQLSPLHICLMVISEWFEIPPAGLIKKTILPVCIFCAAALAYYLLLIRIL